MVAAADVTAGVLAGIASLGVPWWAWAALAVMIFSGLLAPALADAAELEEEPSRARR